jgi:4-hydroxy-tetrahydrodipicolinate reductase
MNRSGNGESSTAGRGGDIVGDHSVMFSGNYETITLSHRAYDRAVFAQGALKAAKWVIGKEPGIYGMNDVLDLVTVTRG